MLLPYRTVHTAHISSEFLKKCINLLSAFFPCFSTYSQHFYKVDIDTINAPTWSILCENVLIKSPLITLRATLLFVFPSSSLYSCDDNYFTWLVFGFKFCKQWILLRIEYLYAVRMHQEDKKKCRRKNAVWRWSASDLFTIYWRYHGLRISLCAAFFFLKGQKLFYVALQSTESIKLQMHKILLPLINFVKIKTLANRQRSKRQWEGETRRTICVIEMRIRREQQHEEDRSS